MPSSVMPISVNIEAQQTREGVNVRSVSTLEQVYTNKMAQDPLEDFHPRLRDQKRWVSRCNPSTVRWSAQHHNKIVDQRFEIGRWN